MRPKTKVTSGPMRAARAIAFAALLPVSASAGFAQDGGPVAETLPTVTVATARVNEVRAVVPVAGTVVPLREVLVTPELSGLQIRQVLVDIGDNVTKGQLLIRLKRDQAEADLSQAEAEVARARSAVRQAESQIASTKARADRLAGELDRVQRLSDSGSASQSTLDEAAASSEEAEAAAASARDGLAIAKAQLAQAESQRDVAALHLSQTDIAAPVYGVVGARSADVGALTGQSAEPLLTVYENGSMELSAQVIETALSQLEAGDGGTITIAGIPPLIGLVRVVSPTVDPVTRLGDVRITLEGDPGLRSGLFGSGEIETDRRRAVTVPITAVLSDDKGAFVQVVSDGAVSRRAVKTGLVWQGQREIVDGLKDGEVVVARAGAFLRDGDRVNTVAAPDDAQ